MVRCVELGARRGGRVDGAVAALRGQTVADISQNVFANLAWDKIRLPAPVFEGDTLYSRTTVLGARESASRPEVGIVQVATEGYNQRDEVVVSFERTVMVYRRGHGPRFAAKPAGETA